MCARRIGEGGEHPLPSSRNPRKWLNSSRVAEISHCGTCNFSSILEFK
jgi:hypothetical protein